MNTQNSKQIVLAKQIVESSSVSEREALLKWATELLEVRNSNLTLREKAKSSIRLTKKYKVIWPLLKQLSLKIKQYGWDERSLKVRFGLGAVLVTAIAFGNAGAGIAALGGAIGVPLWVVLGAGGTFAGILVEEILSKKNNVQTSYTVINAEKENES